MARTTPRPELEPFIELNKREKAKKAAGIKISTLEAWRERYVLIKAHFPIVEQIDWMKAFNDKELYGRLWKDILRVDQQELDEENSGQGPRPLDPKRAKERLRQLQGDDYSYLPFHEAFTNLAGKRSIRHLASKIGLGKHVTWNFKNGVKEPDLYTLEQIARAFGKDPSYFLEYRLAYIVGAIASRMELAPEMTVDMYRELRQQTKKR